MMQINAPLDADLTSDIEEKDNTDFIQYAKSIDSDTISDMLALRVLPSFLFSVNRHGKFPFSTETLTYWIVDMLLQGLKPSTAKRYLGALHNLYSNWVESSGYEGEIPDFSSSILDNYKFPDSGKIIDEIEKNLKCVENLTKVSGNPQSHDFVINRAFQFLLFEPEATLFDIIQFKFSDAADLNPHLEDIVISMRKAPQTKYVFPLAQGKSRLQAIMKSLLSDLHACGKKHGMQFCSGFSRESITSIWILAAVRLGLPLSSVVAIVKSLPPVFSFMAAIPPANLSVTDRNQVINKVAAAIADKTPGWFVARLRTGTTVQRITDRLKDLKSPLFHQVQFYYPLRPVRKMEKKKMITVDIPVLPGILFFRLPYDKVTMLMAQIGDLAWCFRTTSSPRSPYSVISKDEMKAFQRSVGLFTPDIEIDIVTKLPDLNVGDEVLIEDGSILDGQHATIRKVRSVNGTLTFTLRISDTAFIRWKDVNVEASRIAKVER